MLALLCFATEFSVNKDLHKPLYFQAPCATALPPLTKTGSALCCCPMAPGILVTQLVVRETPRSLLSKSPQTDKLEQVAAVMAAAGRIATAPANKAEYIDRGRSWASPSMFPKSASLRGDAVQYKTI